MAPQRDRLACFSLRYNCGLAGRGPPHLLDMPGWAVDRSAFDAPLPLPQLRALKLYRQMAAAVCRHTVGVAAQPAGACFEVF
jgi:hypothetical protein